MDTGKGDRHAIFTKWDVDTQLFVFNFFPHSVACGILVPQPGIQPEPSALGAQSQPLDRQGRPTGLFVFKYSQHCKCYTGLLGPLFPSHLSPSMPLLFELGIQPNFIGDEVPGTEHGLNGEP